MVALKDPPVVLLAGTEQFLKEENLTRLKSAFLDKESRVFNFNVFYAGSAAAEEILECARTLPFLGRKRVVLVRGCEDFSASDKELILSYLAAPHRLTVLVLETSESNLNQSFFGEICKYARVLPCNPLRHKQLFGWIESQVEAGNKKIEENARAALIANLGDNLRLLLGALNNLVLYIGERETIRYCDVERLVGRAVTTNSFKLFDAVVARDKQKALQILDSLFKDGINSSQILGALAHKIMSERGRMKSSLLDESLQDLQKTDADIKTGRQNQRFALELLVVRLLNLF